MDKQTITKLQGTAAALVDAIEARDLRIAELEAERPALVAKGIEAAADTAQAIGQNYGDAVETARFACRKTDVLDGKSAAAWECAKQIRALKARAQEIADG